MHHILPYSSGNINFRYRVTNVLVQQPLAGQGLVIIEASQSLNCGFSIPLCVRIMVYFIGPSLYNNVVQCLYYATNN